MQLLQDIAPKCAKGNAAVAEVVAKRIDSMRMTMDQIVGIIFGSVCNMVDKSKMEYSGC